MAQRFAGVAYIYANGRQLPLRGNMTVSITKFERTGIAGQDGVHGYSEMPRVPFIEVDISKLGDVSVEELDGITEATVTAEAADGTTYILKEAWTAGVREVNTAEGSVRVRFEGMEGIEA